MGKQKKESKIRAFYNGNHEHDEAVVSQLSRMASDISDSKEIEKLDKAINLGLNAWKKKYEKEKRHNADEWLSVIKTVIKGVYAANYELMRKPAYPERLFIKNAHLLRGIAQYDEILPDEITLKLFEMKLKRPERYNRNFGKIDELIIAQMQTLKSPIPLDLVLDFLELRVKDKKGADQKFGDLSDSLENSITPAAFSNLEMKYALRLLMIKITDPSSYKKYFDKFDNKIMTEIQKYTTRRGD